VLGFTRHEIAAILLGEIAVYVVSAVPLGLCMGYGLTELVARMMDPELYRLEVDTSAKTWAFAVAVTLGSAVVSALLVRRRIDRLDLVAVLKTRE
jgi:putative ABC transport system permease protein